MYCPHCNREHDNGVSICPICKTPLTNDKADSDRTRNIKFVTVYEAGDPAFLAFAKSILESEGIAYYFKGEGLQDLEGAGRLGTGFNPLFGPVQIQVDEKDAQKARELLEQIERNKVDLPESEVEQTGKADILSSSMPGKKAAKGLWWGVCIGILISVVAYYVYDAIQRYRQTNHSWMSYQDTNQDGKNDMTYYYDKGVLSWMEEDRNYDGKIDGKWFYKEGVVDYCLLDENYDGVFEAKSIYQKGILHQAFTDLNQDKNPEIVDDYVDGVIYKSDYYHEVTHKIWKTTFYRRGIVRLEQIDEDGDGVLETEIQYNDVGRPVKKGKLKP